MNDIGNNHVVVAVNDAGVAEAFGLYDADDARRLAAVAGRFAMTWIFDLDHDDMTARMAGTPTTTVLEPPPALDDGPSDGDGGTDDDDADDSPAA